MRFLHTAVGSVKETTKFLLLPMRIDLETRWLERVTIQWQYVIFGSSALWQPIKFMQRKDEVEEDGE